MKKLISVFIITIIASTSLLFGQSSNTPSDSLTKFLCKKWTINYALMGGMKITRLPDAEQINYQFNKDKTFILTSNNPKDRTKGTWNYDSKKKIIRLAIDGKSNSSIISLKEEELVIVLDASDSAPKDLPEMKLVYKVVK